MKEATLQNRSKHAAFSRLHRISVNNSGLLKEQGIDPAHAIMIGNDGNCDIAGARQVGLHTLYLHSETSPKGDDPVADYKLSEPDMKMVKKILLEENGLR